MANARHANFGVSHSSSVITVYRTEVALTVNQHVAQGKTLRHPHDGVVHRRIAVRVIFTDDVTDDTRRFLVCLVPVVAQLVHGEKNAAMYRLQTVANIR